MTLCMEKMIILRHALPRKINSLYQFATLYSVFLAKRFGMMALATFPARRSWLAGAAQLT